MVTKKPSGKLYNTVWRWHFYAGLFVAPFALLLAITGGLYLFQPQIENWLYADLYNVAGSKVEVSADQQLTTALAQIPGSKALAYTPPASETRSALIRVQAPDWRQFTIAIDPHTGKVLGMIEDGKRIMQTIRNLHGKLLSGTIGQAIMELAASWAMVLLVTGLYLWWPRNKADIFGTVLPRLKAKGRIFWRDLHAVTGFWVSILLVFLILTGLPWSLVAGKTISMFQANVGKGAPQTGLGWDGGGSKTIKSTIDQGWATNHAEHLAGQVHSDKHAGMTPLSLTKIATIAQGIKGITAPFEIRLPVDAQGVYSIVNVHESNPAATAYIHLDQYNGKVISEARWSDFGIIAKGISLGVFIHEGRYFGLANQLLGLAACLGLICMVTAGIIMWWKRRPTGSLGAPKAAKQVHIGTAVIGIAVVLSILMPLMGASLVLILIGEWIARKRLA
jgi:uncharacterized iron-regulated membrane protein